MMNRLLFFAVSCSCVLLSAEKSEVPDFQKAGRFSPDTPFDVTVGEKKLTFKVSAEGRVEVRTGSGQIRRKSFGLPRLAQDRIDFVQVVPYKGDFLFLFETSDGEAGGGQLIRVHPEAYSLVWKADIPGFNIARPLYEEDAVYLGASGFVGKVHLDTGKYLWTLGDLYKKYGINSFKSIDIQGDSVTFHSGVGDFQLEKKTGSLIKAPPIK